MKQIICWDCLTGDDHYHYFYKKNNVVEMRIHHSYDKQIMEQMKWNWRDDS